MGKRKKLVIGIAGGISLFAFLVVFFLLTKEFFFQKFSYGITLSNTDVSSMTVSQALETMNSTEHFDLTVKKEDKEFVIDISDAVSRTFDRNQIEKSREEISLVDYVVRREKSMSVKPVSVGIDQDSLRSKLEESLPEPEKYTSDAYFDAELNLVEEVQGDDVDYSLFIEKISEDIAEGNILVYDITQFYNHPQVTADDPAISNTKEEIDQYKNMKITFTFGDKKEVLDGDDIGKHLVYEEGTLKLKTKWVSTFVRNMAKKYNTYGKTRKFKTTKDKTIQIKGGILGWWINEEETVKSIKKLLKNKKSKTLEPVYRNVAVLHGKDDIGDTYVEISLTRQHLWFYKKGKLKMQCKIVSGLPTKERQTVRGAHRIYGKQRDRYLGTIAVQGYHTHVNYWMPFNWDGQGLHDATWRSKFGGNLYRSGGSHGCVNMPLDQAAKLYDMVSIGTPVIVY